MANHRPKSLNELNQVYDKALQAQRAIKQGSLSLNDENTPPEKPSSNIFDELKEQAAQAKKTELYDADIANIANDFLKRYSKPEQKTPASRELKRPAPSIQSLYHTPVKPAEQESSDVPLNIGETPVSAVPQVNSAAPTRPKSPESIVSPSPAAIESEPDTPEEPEDIIAPTAISAAPSQEQLRRAATEQAQHEVYTAKHEVSPTVRVTSAERSDLINEYLRVMSDDDDGYYDDEEEKKPKKGGFWSRLKKRRQDAPKEEEILPESVDTENKEDTPLTDIYSDYAEEETAKENTPETNGEDVPLSLYDYIEADFDFGEDEETAEESFVEVSEEEIQKEPEDGTYPTEPEEGTYPTEPEEGTYPTEPEEGTYPTEPEEEVIYPEEPAEDVIYPTESGEDYPEEPAENVIYPTEDENEDIPAEAEEAEIEQSPTAGMVFDDVFSVSDESKRSYTGGNWSGTYEENFSEDNSERESEPDDSSDYVENDSAEAVIPAPEKKKRSPVLTVILSSLLVLLIFCTAAVGALGSIIGIDTGKLFFDKYRAFTAEQDFSFSGITAGDLVITEDYDDYAAEGDAFVYVSHESQKFMLGKHSGSTYNLTGDVLFIAENEAGRVLVLREDTLGAVTKTYKGLGSILSPISNNYIIIVAVLLVLCLAVLLALIIPRLRKADKNVAYPESGTVAREQKEEEYTKKQESEDSDDDDSDDDDYDYDTDGIEEGLFSGI